MRPQLQLQEMNNLNNIHEEIFVKQENISYNNFEEIMDNLYITKAHSFLETEENIKLPYWKRFSYFYLFNSFVATMMFFPHSSSPLFPLYLTLLATGSLFLAKNKNSSSIIFSMFGFISNKMKEKLHITHEIRHFKEFVATPILKDKNNQLLLLNYYHKFYEENSHVLSQNTKNEIEYFKESLEKEKYENALEAIYQLFKKINYVKNLQN